MRAAPVIGLSALAAGAILTFAVSARVPGINLRIAGVIIMLTAIAGLVAPTEAGAWLRRRARLHVPHGVAHERGESAFDEPEDAGYPAFLLQDPAVLAAEVLKSTAAVSPAGESGEDEGSSNVRRMF
jgi:hypothetical protein